MITVRQSNVYRTWFAGLRDERAKDRIDIRIRRLSLGNAGDSKSVGGGVSELRVDYGPGYRVYFTRRANGDLVILLCGGDKRSQSDDIARAKAMVREMGDL